MKELPLINEALGVAKSTTFYTKRLTKMVIDEFYDFVDDAKTLGKGASEPYVGDKALSYYQIKNLIPSTDRDVYLDFPVSEILVSVIIEKKDREEMLDSDGFEVPYLIGGYASPFAKGREKYATRFKPSIRQKVDHSLSIHLTIEINYGNKFRKISTSHPQFENTHLFKKVESVILHELNHLYEFYKRRLSGSSSIGTSLTWASIGEDIYKDLPKDVIKYWQDEFTTYIYAAEKHELNAQVQEMKAYSDKMNFDKFRRLFQYKQAKDMQSWNYEEFLNEMTNRLDKHKLTISIVDIMKEQFILEYEKNLKELDEIPKIDPVKLRKMSTEKFFKFFEKIIKEAGETLIRGYCRLYALKEIKKEY